MPPLSPEDAALFETLTPELAAALYPDQTASPFRITMVYPELTGESGRAARGLEEAAVAHRVETARTPREAPRHRATFSLRQVEEFHELYHLAERASGAAAIDLLLNDKTVPLARELWLPLLWTLRA